MCSACAGGVGGWSQDSRRKAGELITSSRAEWFLGDRNLVTINRMNTMNIEEKPWLFYLRKKCPTKMDGMFKISTKEQEFANYQSETLSGLKEQPGGNYKAETTSASRGDTLIELHFPVKTNY